MELRLTVRVSCDFTSKVGFSAIKLVYRYMNVHIYMFIWNNYLFTSEAHVVIFSYFSGSLLGIKKQVCN